MQKDDQQIPLPGQLKFLFTLLLALALIPLSTSAQGGMDKVEIKTTKVAGNVYMLEGRGGNIGVCAGPDGVFMIDDQFAPLTEKILAAIQSISKKPVRFLINTHWHGDHTGGNENLGKRGVAIVAHKNVRKLLSSDQVMKIFNRKVPASPKAALPIITFSKSITFHLNGETIKVEHIPQGHTNGDSFIYFKKANVIHTGDLFFNGFFPFIDVEHGGSIDGIIEAANQLLAVGNEKTKIIPGHGPLASKEDLKEYRDMLVSVRKMVQSAWKNKKTIYHVAESKDYQKISQKWGKGFISGTVFLKIFLLSKRKKKKNDQK